MLTIDHLPDNPEKLKAIIDRLYRDNKEKDIVNNIYKSENNNLSKKNLRLSGSKLKLETEIKSLNDKVIKLNSEVDRINSDNSNLNELIRLLKRKYFAPKSEEYIKEQILLFNEAELNIQDAESNDDAQKKAVKSYKRGKPKRKPLPDFLPRKDVVLDVSEEEKKCSIHGSTMKKIGEEVSEQLEIIPAQITVIRTIRPKYSCDICDGNIVIAPVEPKPIPKSIATAGLLAFIAISKYIDGLPLYRIEDVLQRSKVDIPRNTMSSWMIKVGELLTPLLNLMNEDLIQSTYISCDETKVQVLKEVGKKATTLSYMWVRGREGPNPIIIFEYDPSRSSEVPLRLMEDYEGYLHLDGYKGYNKLCKKKTIVRVSCWSHVRRKYFDAFKASQKAKGKSQEMLDYIKDLYEIEDEIKDLEVLEKKEIRQNKSKPLIEEIKTWLETYIKEVPPKSLLGKAIQYTLNEWPGLIVFLEDGRIRIDNNFIENAIRPFAVGRKNWLFSSTVNGAKSSAAIYSILETAKANGHEPYSYLKRVLEDIPKAVELSDYEALLPYKLTPVK